MSRKRDVIRTVVIVVATVLATEWLHHRLGDPTLFSLSRQTTQVITDPEGDSEAVSGSEFQEYLRVLESMQADHGLSLEKATVKGGITVSEFREIERRVHKDEALVARTREQLRKNAEEIWDSRRSTLGPRDRRP